MFERTLLEDIVMISLSDLRQFKQQGRRFSCLTCYDASMAKAMELAEIDSILIGDSLGMTIQWHTIRLQCDVLINIHLS